MHPEYVRYLEDTGAVWRIEFSGRTPCWEEGRLAGTEFGAVGMNRWQKEWILFSKLKGL